MAGISGVYLYDNKGNIIGATGGKLTKLKNIEADPDYYRKLGKLGGAKSSNGGFASSKVGNDGLTGLQRASIVGAKGGRTLRRKAVK